MKETDSRSLWQKVCGLLLVPVYYPLNFSKIVPESWACRLYVLTVLIQTAIDLGIEGDILIRIDQVSVLGPF
jgi:hypothetical protein